MKQVVLASNNKKKLGELRGLLLPLGLQVQAQAELGVTPAQETGLTFIENAIIKARHASRQTNLATIADDSGLVIDALGGAPGLYSARYAGENASDEDNINKVIQRLKELNLTESSASFVCTIVYLKHYADPAPILCQGVWQGNIILTPQGEHGFGYDPIFWVSEHHCTSAQLIPEMKNQLSHRGKAIQQLIQQLRP